MGSDYNKDGFDIMAYAHENLMAAWKQQTVLVTCPPAVENISYVESKTELTDTNTINSYRTRTLSTLGISFLMDTSSQSVSTATISVSQLMKTIFDCHGGVTVVYKVLNLVLKNGARAAEPGEFTKRE